MSDRKSHIAEGIALIGISIAFAITCFTVHKYYGPILLLCIGAIMIALSFLAEKQERKPPVVGVLLVILGAALLVEIISSGKEVVLTVLLLIVVAAEGVKMLFR
jgi:uncharacterized membrane protein HdeD (DUF308 family)